MSDAQTPREMWERRYGGDSYIYGKQPNEFLAEHVRELPTGQVLCLAEGEGRNAVFLARAGFKVSSVDLTEAGVAKTLRLAGETGVHVDAHVGDLGHFDLGFERWDAVVSIFAHTASDVRRDVHRRVVESLRPGGAFLLEAYTPAQIGRGTGGPSNSDMMMTLEGLREELRGLEIEFGAECEREIMEGDGHTGVGSVVQVVATKPMLS